jgi:molybdopterin converting factor subunit 1
MGAAMIVTVQLFAGAKDLAGRDSVTVELSAGARVADLRKAVEEKVPALAALLRRSAVAVDDEFAGDEMTLAEGKRIALLPPVSGG